MNSTIIPFSTTAMFTPEIAKACEQILGRNPIRSLDSLGLKPNSPKGVLGFLESFHSSSIILKNADTSLSHISIGFLVFNEDERIILDLCRFIRVDHIISKEETSVILTSSISDWIDTLLSVSRVVKSRTFDYTEIRSVLNCIQAYLEQAGFSDVLGNYRKETLSDKTFYLERK